MERHLRVIGFLHLALGVLGVVTCLVILIAAGGFGGVLLINARVGGSTATLEGKLTLAMMAYLFLTAPPLIATGLGLLKVQEWARNLGTIISIVLLVHVPLGTVVGIYSLWVLTSLEVEPLFQAPPGPPRSGFAGRRPS